MGDAVPATEVILVDNNGDLISSSLVGSVRALSTRLYDSAGNPLSIVEGSAIGGTQGGYLAMGRDASGNASHFAIDASRRQLVDIAAQTLTAVKVSKDASANAANNAIHVVPSDGTAAFGVTGNPFFVNVKDGSGNAITSSAGGASSRNLDVTVRDFMGPVANQASTFGALTTTTTNADQVVVTITVPAGKDFFYCGHALTKNAATTVDMNPARLRVGANAWMNRVSTGITDRFWEPNPPAFPVKLATAGEVVTLTVTPNSVTSTAWRGVIWGFYRDI